MWGYGWNGVVVPEPWWNLIVVSGSDCQRIEGFGWCQKGAVGLLFADVGQEGASDGVGIGLLDVLERVVPVRRAVWWHQGRLLGRNE